jgi:hypothetical protein
MNLEKQESINHNFLEKWLTLKGKVRSEVEKRISGVLDGLFDLGGDSLHVCYIN